MASARRVQMKQRKVLGELLEMAEGLAIEIKAVQVQQEEILALLRAKEKPVKKQDQDG